MASLMRLKVLLLTLLLSSLAMADRPAEREQFRDGWQAASRGDWAAVQAAIEALPDYPLTSFLRAELKRGQIDRVAPGEISAFLDAHRGWSFAAGLETAWLRSLGQRGDFASLQGHGRASRDTEVRCWLARADIQSGATEGVAARIAELWLVGRSQPAVCDPAFAWWRTQGHPSTEQGQQRFTLAMQAGQVGLARYLTRYLTHEQREWAERWLTVHARPDALPALAAQWPDHPEARRLVVLSLQRLARSDWQRADAYWESLAPRFRFPAEERAAVEREIALFSAVALHPDAPVRIDALPAPVQDQQMLEWRARSAMANGDWQQVLKSIERMSPPDQAQGRWRYWRARALAELERPEAAAAFASLASEATYHGFLAAIWLGQDLSLCEQSLGADAGIQDRLLADAEFTRALELHQVGLMHHARLTWASAWRRLSDEDRHQAALLAAGQGWHDRSIAALGALGTLQAYPWRFPMIEQARVRSYSERWRVNPALVYGLMRAESAMQPDALSPAGARGLLQLMPGTASEVARRNGLPFNGNAGLMDPAINIPLGVAHLAELQARYDGQWIFVAAAYNAGINAVSRWLRDRPLNDPDVWLETLPFFETRDYVPRVLAFATIYEWLIERQPQVLAANILPGRVNGQAGFQCSEGIPAPRQSARPGDFE
ncbi:MAG: lytic transglycosylase domain-containing protein [Chromatiales bacterium]|nr:lytic transglycosylase domain-containing protein [Chromatiales bacterium]